MLHYLLYFLVCCLHHGALQIEEHTLLEPEPRRYSTGENRRYGHYRVAGAQRWQPGHLHGASCTNSASRRMLAFPLDSLVL
jgi:hypothetical protein